MLLRQKNKSTIMSSHHDSNAHRARENYFHLFSYPKSEIQKIKSDFILKKKGITKKDITAKKWLRRLNPFHIICNLVGKPLNALIGLVDYLDRKGTPYEGKPNDKDSSILAIITKSLILGIGGILELPFYLASVTAGKLLDFVLLDPASTAINRLIRYIEESKEAKVSPHTPTTAFEANTREILDAKNLAIIREQLPYEYRFLLSDDVKPHPIPEHKQETPKNSRTSSAVILGALDSIMPLETLRQTQQIEMTNVSSHSPTPLSASSSPVLLDSIHIPQQQNIEPEKKTSEITSTSSMQRR